MKVELLEATEKPEEVICRAARNDYMSEYGAEMYFDEVMEGVDGATTLDKKETLIHHLLSREHYGPLEHVQMAVHASGVSRVTMAQITRHRHLSFDVQSQRYVDFEDADYTTPPSLTDPDHFSRETGTVDVDEETREEMRALYDVRVEGAIEAYNEMVDAGIPKEDARFVLPNATEVNMVISGNLRAWLHVVNMRMKADAQSEIRDLSKLVCEHIEEWAPITYEWFEENAPVSLGL